ncbi:MAG: hypothetical protein ACSHX8_06725 [Opitutaceae bacterium]
MTPKTHIKWWQWLNVTALDAAAIAISWQWIFATSTGTILNGYTYAILGTSVWLTYMADRLFDVKQCKVEELLSNRHQFAQKHQKQLWRYWWGLLIFDVCMALYRLTWNELRSGIFLLIICLVYTFANQRLSNRFFPKEICVAIIFTGGVTVFQQAQINYLALFAFFLLCLTSCLAIGHKERDVDKALGVKSIASKLSPHCTWLCMLSALILCFCMPLQQAISIGIPLTALCVLYALRDYLSVEKFRILIDSSLFFGVIPAVMTVIIN